MTPPLEKAVQRDVVRFFEGLGCTVYSLSQARASRQTPGLPDLWVFCPRKRLAFWWETKAEWGRVSEAQAAFADDCRTCGIRHAWGGMAAARTLAATLGLTWAPAA